MMNSVEYRHYRPLAYRWFSEPMCVTLFSGSDPARIAEIFEADISSRAEMALLDVFVEHYDEALETVLVGPFGSGTLAIEPNGSTGSLSETLRRVHSRVKWSRGDGGG